MLRHFVLSAGSPRGCWGRADGPPRFGVEFWVFPHAGSPKSSTLDGIFHDKPSSYLGVVSLHHCEFREEQIVR